MPSDRVETAHLLPGLRRRLLRLLGGLSPDEWAAPTSCPGWSVRDVAAHLLGVEAANVSFRRDGWRVEPAPGERVDAWLNEFNGEWVAACRRLSPAVLVALLDVASAQFDDHVTGLDLDAMGGPVTWATGANPAPVWLDLAREYMERFVHQQQIREAVSRPPLEPEFVAPVIATAVHALPFALRSTARPAGTAVRFVVEGAAGGTWMVVNGGGGWELHAGGVNAPLGEAVAEAVAEVRTSVDGALKLFVRDPSAPALRASGDAELIAAVAQVKAVMG